LSKLLCRLCVQWTNDVISGLLYNSEYFFDVECVLDRQKHSANVTLTTPGCSILIDDSFKRCSLIGPPLAGALTSRRVLRLVDSRRRDTAGVGRRALCVCVCPCVQRSRSQWTLSYWSTWRVWLQSTSIGRSCPSGSAGSYRRSAWIDVTGIQW